MKNKKTALAIIGVIGVVLITIGITYAYWLVTKTQAGNNVITAGCLDITLDGEANDINLTNQFPLSDEEGVELVPYEFTVTNNCNTAVDYQVNLESIGTESTAIIADALKVAIGDTPVILGNKLEVEPTISGAYASHMLVIGTLAAKSDNSTANSVSYKLRLWIDANAPISEMNKAYTGKISVTVGQGINNSIKEGTLAYNIVEQNGGLKSISGASHQWVESEFEDMDLSDGLNEFSATTKYYWGTDYEFDPVEGKYKLSGKVIKSTVADCRSGANDCGPYTLHSTSATYTYGLLYKIISWTNSETNDTDSDYSWVTLQIKYIVPEYRLYAALDDLGTSYYFKGDVENNYVQFGSYATNATTTVYDYANMESKEITFTEETPMYWRIVRINGDGTIRLIYDGTEKIKNGVAHTSNIGSTQYNSYSDDPKYFGYTYDDGTGKQVDSTIKDYLDTWYNSYLKTNYGKYIADGIFCTAREITQYYDWANDVYTTTQPTGDYDVYYGTSTKFICARKEDRYTTEKGIGNGLLTNPVGLITADEVSSAGENHTDYIYNGESYWTSSPYSSYGGVAWLMRVSDSGYLDSEYDVGTSELVRPVINLRSDVTFTGDGSFETPYEIVME